MTREQKMESLTAYEEKLEQAKRRLGYGIKAFEALLKQDIEECGQCIKQLQKELK